MRGGERQVDVGVLGGCNMWMRVEGGQVDEDEGGRGKGQGDR